MSEDTAKHDAVMFPYFWALGMFVHEFAETEAYVKLLLRVEANLPREVEGVLFSEVALARAIMNVRSIRSEKNALVDVDLERALTQLDLIAKFRNSVIHHGSQITKDEIISSNRIITKKSKPKTSYKSSHDILCEMICDLKVIRYGIMSYIYKQCVVIDDPSLDEHSIALMQSTQSAAGAPWHYKPPQNPQAHRRREKKPK
ncbi:hypothetical protein HW537_14940 [Asaia siamensis]